MATEAFAPAKVNLTLHVTGQRADGYHLLDSLVVFADVGDRITAVAGDRLSLAVTGPMAEGIPVNDSNLVLRAARMLRGDDEGPGATITLDKHLPVASGIGGGSSDAAAALRALSRLWGRPLPPEAEIAKLGADVPVCLAARPRRMSGVGEVLVDVPPLPSAWLVLANPRVAVPTPAVFAALTDKEGAPMPAELPRWADAADLAAFLGGMRNDLEPPARSIAPVIGEVADALSAQHGCLIARMSGSGATVFGLFADPSDAAEAARRLRAAHPDWWVEDAGLYAPS
ncbi:4-(cytidine 5'-diphospho)-2-C-methyl-D-erythritol kinase [Ostreiculturibacter nitratireducens]|uniref:4-(cytidine 5'-diphospho)-2-C-methyl-D-erythritol kinase n=1 Tax=Ostreiculturibacter nitratireducens TaxID=3075226 RepID=UPI0031B6441C